MLAALATSPGLRPGVGVEQGRRAIGMVRDPRAEPGARGYFA